MSYLRLIFLGLILSLSFNAFAATPVDINQADAQTLADTMKGVGLVKAQAIIDYREKNGNFTSVDDLVNVKGIGLRTLALNKDLISANSKPSKQATAERLQR